MADDYGTEFAAAIEQALERNARLKGLLEEMQPQDRTEVMELLQALPRELWHPLAALLGHYYGNAASGFTLAAQMMPGPPTEATTRIRKAADAFKDRHRRLIEVLTIRS